LCGELWEGAPFGMSLVVVFILFISLDDAWFSDFNVISLFIYLSDNLIDDFPSDISSNSASS